MKNLYLILLLLFSFAGWSQISGDEKKSLEFADYFFDAMNERLKSNYEKSNEYFEQCLALDDTNDVVYFKMAQNFADAKNYDEAWQYVEVAQKLNPDNKWYKKLYIDIKIDSGTPRDEIKKMIKDFEEVAQNKYLIQSLYRKMYRKTVQVNYQKAKTKKPQSSENNLADLWQQKKYADLLKTGEKLLDEQPDNPRIYLYMAQAHLGMNQAKKALDYLDMGSDFILSDKNMQKAYYQEYIKAYKALNKPKKVKLYQTKLAKI